VARILVVEDEGVLRDILRRALERGGHEVAVAEDGEAGIACLQRFMPDLVVTDVIMPKMGGIVFIREIRKVSPELPVIAISGGGRTGRFNFLSTARTFPKVWSVKKPVSIADFLRLVDDILSGSAAAQGAAAGHCALHS